MVDIKGIDTVVPDQRALSTRRVQRKDEKLSDEEKQRLLRKKRAQARKQARDDPADDEDSSPKGEVNIRV